MRVQLTASVVTLTAVALSASILYGTDDESVRTTKVRPKPLNLAALNTPANEDDPFVSRDGTRLLYTSDASGRWSLLASAQRKRNTFFPESEHWPAGREIEGPNSGDDNASPHLTVDGHDLYYAEKTVVKAPAGEGQPPPNYEIVHSIRSDLRNLGVFTGPTFVQSVCTEADEKHPWLTEDGTELYFSRKTEEGWRVFVARRPAATKGSPRGAFGPPELVQGLPAGFQHASLSRDAKTVYLQGPLDKKRWGLFRATRASLKAGWGKPEILAGLDDPQAPTGDQAPCVSRDGSKLYFASDRPGGKGGRDLWVVETRWFKKQ